jgi:hydrogenase nickel incorporation protein HypA/HybF
MHELAITQSILGIALDEAAKRNVSRVISIKISIGDFSGVIPQLIQEYYNIASKGTVAENAKLILERVPITISCLSCGTESTVLMTSVKCPECGSDQIKLLTGREFYVNSLEVE